MSSCGSAARAERAEEEMSEGRVITSRRRFVLKSWKAVEVEGRCFHRRDRRRRRDSWHYRSNYAADVCNVWRLRDLNRVLQDVESRFQRGVGVRLVFLTWCWGICVHASRRGDKANEAPHCHIQHSGSLLRTPSICWLAPPPACAVSCGGLCFFRRPSVCRRDSLPLKAQDFVLKGNCSLCVLTLRRWIWRAAVLGLHAGGERDDRHGNSLCGRSVRDGWRWWGIQKTPNKRCKKKKKAEGYEWLKLICRVSCKSAPFQSFEFVALEVE